MNNPFFYIVLGFVAGVFSGFLGLGGGTILIPVFVFILGFTQHKAQGTTLALMIPPIGLLAAWKYWTKGNVNIKVALFVCVGFFVGGYLGASLVTYIPDHLLKKLFAVFLMFIAIKMFFGR